MSNTKITSELKKLVTFKMIVTSSGTPIVSEVQGGSVQITNNQDGTYDIISYDPITHFRLENDNTPTKVKMVKSDTLTSLYQSFSNLGSLTEFVAQGHFKNVTDFRLVWIGCSSLTKFPKINTSKGTNFRFTWSGCSSLTKFPLIDTSKGTNFRYAWSDCSSLTKFPKINTSKGTNFRFTWTSCSSLTSFPKLDTSKGTDFSYAWSDCSSLTSFPHLDTSKGTDFSYAWSDCKSLTKFPNIDTSKGTDFSMRGVIVLH